MHIRSNAKFSAYTRNAIIIRRVTLHKPTIDYIQVQAGCFSRTYDYNCLAQPYPAFLKLN